MSAAITTLGHRADAHHDDGLKTTAGFRIFLMSDYLVFAVLFATFGVLDNTTAGEPAGSRLFELPFLLAETALLLSSVGR